MLCYGQTVNLMSSKAQGDNFGFPAPSGCRINPACRLASPPGLMRGRFPLSSRGGEDWGEKGGSFEVRGPKEGRIPKPEAEGDSDFGFGLLSTFGFPAPPGCALRVSTVPLCSPPLDSYENLREHSPATDRGFLPLALAPLLRHGARGLLGVGAWGQTWLMRLMRSFKA